MDGTIRLHLSRPVNGWISKLTGLITKISIDKSTKIPVSGEGKINDKDREKQKQKEKGKEKEKEKENDNERSDDDQWAILERMDDDLEHWGGNEIFRKEDRFFGTLQGSGYQVIDTIVIHVKLVALVFFELYIRERQCNIPLDSIRVAVHTWVFGPRDDDHYFYDSLTLHYAFFCVSCIIFSPLFSFFLHLHSLNFPYNFFILSLFSSAFVIFPLYLALVCGSIPSKRADLV